MDTQPDKIKQKETLSQLQALEKEVKMAFKSGQYESVMAGVKSIKTLDSKNRFAENMARKVEETKKKEEQKAKEAKVKEYKIMLKKLFKDRDVAKLKALAVEFLGLDPENRIARGWLRKAEKMEAKLRGKNVKTEKIEKAETKIPLLFGQSGLFKKPEVILPKPAIAPTIATRPSEVKPSEAILVAQKGAPKPATAPVIMTKPTEQKVPEVKAAPLAGLFKKPEAEAPKTATTGNVFTKMFGKKEEETQKKSIIDTIVARGEQKEVKASEKPTEAPKAEKPKDAAGFLTFAKVFMNFAIIFIILSAAFLYVEWIDKENTMLSMVGISENTGAKLYNAAAEVDGLTQKEAELNKEIDLYKGGYDDKTFATVQKIIKDRINWPDIFAKINEVTNSVYELNDFFKYIEYNNYSFDADSGTIRVTGSLSDPLGRNLTKLVELEEAFKYFPKDRNDPDDKTLPYFTGFKEFNSFSKSLDETTGRYNSTFQLSFTLNKTQ
jgi:hypothetical protein